MHYTDAELGRFLDEATNRLSAATSAGIAADLDAYIDFECMKSVVNDGCRYLARLDSGATHDEVATLADEYAWKLDLAASRLGLRIA